MIRLIKDQKITWICARCDQRQKTLLKDMFFKRIKDKTIAVCKRCSK